MAVIQALVSVVNDAGDTLRSISVGATAVSFLARGQLTYVAVSSRSEPLRALRRQLELLHQAVLMVVTSGVLREM
jgi:vacuolar fusion protein MON1